MYQVGLMETDQHIEYFWAALESFSQEELCKFIKFACNQERIPQTCPCRDGGTDTAHVPPYPMKMVAPPDGQQGTVYYPMPTVQEQPHTITLITFYKTTLLFSLNYQQHRKKSLFTNLVIGHGISIHCLELETPLQSSTVTSAMLIFFHFIFR